MKKKIAFWMAKGLWTNISHEKFKEELGGRLGQNYRIHSKFQENSTLSAEYTFLNGVHCSIVIV